MRLLVDSIVRATPHIDTRLDAAAFVIVALRHTQLETIALRLVRRFVHR